jgi:hypothetical protein
MAGLRFSFDLDGDGTYEIVNVAQSTQPLQIAQDGIRDVRMRVTDQDGDSNEYVLRLETQNVAPNVNPSLTLNGSTSPGLVDAGAIVTIGGFFTDPGADVWRGEATIRRSGSADVIAPLVVNADKTFSLPYAFNDAGSYTITVNVFDELAGDGTPPTLSVNVATSGLSADFNDSHNVDGADFLLWQRNFGRTTGVTKSHDDADADGAVNVADLAFGSRSLARRRRQRRWPQLRVQIRRSRGAWNPPGLRQLK